MPSNVLDDFHRMHGCEVDAFFAASDDRGDFAKFVDARFLARHPDFVIGEIFVNRSARGVIRGFHLQWPPADHAKLVACIGGSFFDVLLDLRRSSPTYRSFAVRTLTVGQRVYVPRGVAHAFQSLEDHSTMGYATTHAHVPSHDGGVDPLSCPIAWPVADPVVSVRDRGLPAFTSIESPFA